MSNLEPERKYSKNQNAQRKVWIVRFSKKFNGEIKCYK